MGKRFAWTFAWIAACSLSSCGSCEPCGDPSSPCGPVEHDSGADASQDMTLRDARTSEDAATDASSVDAESLEAGADADAFLDASASDAQDGNAALLDAEADGAAEAGLRDGALPVDAASDLGVEAGRADAAASDGGVLGDDNNCGGFGIVCLSGTHCRDGRCQCDGEGGPGQACCGGRWIDVLGDPNNCGACDHQCAPRGDLCVAGACRCGAGEACPGVSDTSLGSICCGGDGGASCQVQTDTNCGTCGTRCFEPQICRVNTLFSEEPTGCCAAPGGDVVCVSR